MVRAYNDWELGITPVSTGRAPWLPGLYLEAVQAVRSAVAAARAAEHERREVARSMGAKG